MPRSQTSRSIAVRLPAGGALRNIYFVFTPSRASLQVASDWTPEGLVLEDAADLLAGKQDSGSNALQRSPEFAYSNVVAFRIVDPTSGQKSLRNLEIESRGEAAQLGSVVIETDKGAMVARSDEEPCLDTIDIQRFEPIPGRIEEHVINGKEYLVQLEKALKKDPGTPPQFRSFFADLDERTSKALGAGGAMDFAVKIVGGMACERLITRRDEEANRPGSYTPYRPSNTQRGELKCIAEDFVACASTHFKPGACGPDPWEGHPEDELPPAAVAAAKAAGIDLSCFERAFEAFADGQLRLRVQPSGMWSTQPSSGFYFFFAEMALLCAEAGFSAPLGPALWVALANVLVRTQESYCVRYRPDVGAAFSPDCDLGSYGACQYREVEAPGETYAARLKRLRREYRSKWVLPELAAACAGNAVCLAPAETCPN